MASILLIDDDEDFCAVTAEILRQAGRTVNNVTDGKTGLALYHAGRHDRTRKGKRVSSPA